MKDKLNKITDEISSAFEEVSHNKFAQIAFILFTGAFTLGFAIGKAVELTLVK